MTTMLAKCLLHCRQGPETTEDFAFRRWQLLVSRASRQYAADVGKARLVARRCWLGLTFVRMEAGYEVE